MSRRLEFDYDRAIDRATRVFWKKGYSNTSLRDLKGAMGIGEGSFYNTLKSKRHLYLECLKHYNDTVLQRRLESLLSEGSAKEGIRAFFRTVLDELDDPKTPRICLFEASLAGEVLAERDLKRYVLDGMAAFSDVFVERLKSAKEKGELPAEVNPETAAQMLVTYLQGLYIVIRVLQDRTQVERQIEILLRGLGL
jgi:TetR/AcrR family transcriptional regulator, transcriptional repressor for nem operon